MFRETIMRYKVLEKTNTEKILKDFCCRSKSRRQRISPGLEAKVKLRRKHRLKLGDTLP